jgi:hypothetical protein
VSFPDDHETTRTDGESRPRLLGRPKAQEGVIVVTRTHIQNIPRVDNDRIYDVLWGVEAEEGSFLCECNQSSCTDEVVMTPGEYVRLRDREELVYAPGHE